MSIQRSIIIDTDPGQDDAVALLLAMASPELELLGITTVAGNVPLARTCVNALKIVELAGRSDIPVHAGASRPLQRELVTAEHVHGKTGLDGADLPEPQTLLAAEGAVDFIVRSLRERPAGSVTLCMLGPLTNLALALRRAPDIAGRIREIVLMGGGCFEGGNITPAAEFNIYVDPEAADLVFRCGAPLVVLPLDVTHQVLGTRERLAALRGLGNRTAAVVADLLSFFERYDVNKYGSAGAPLHDPCVIAYLLQPALFSGRHVNVEIEVSSPLTLGMTVVDWWRVTDRPANATFMRHVDAPAFFALLTQRLQTLP